MKPHLSMPCAAALFGFLLPVCRSGQRRRYVAADESGDQPDAHRFRLRWRFVDGQRQRREREAVDDSRRR